MASVGDLILSGTGTAQSSSVHPEKSFAREWMTHSSIAWEAGAEFNSLLHQMLALIGSRAEQFSQSPEILARMDEGESSENRQIPALLQAAPESVEPNGQGAVLEGPSHGNGSSRWPIEAHLSPIPTGESMVSREVPRPFINSISEAMQGPIPITSPRLGYLEKVFEGPFYPQGSGGGQSTSLLGGLVDRSGLGLAQALSLMVSVHDGVESGSSTYSVPQRLSSPVVDQPTCSESQRLGLPTREGAPTDTRVTALPKGQENQTEPLTNAGLPKSMEVLPAKRLLTQMRELSVPATDFKVEGLMISAAGLKSEGVKRDSGSDSSAHTAEASSTGSSLTHLKSAAQSVYSSEGSLRCLLSRNEEQFSHPSLSLQRLVPMEVEKEVTSDATNVFRYVPDLTRRLSEEIVRNLSLRNLSTSPEIRVTLEPKFLGHINLKVKMEEGKVAALIDVSNPLVKLVLETNLHQLHAALNAKGIEVSRLDVLASGEACGRDPNGQNTWRQRDSHKRQASVDNMEQCQVGRLMGYNTMELVM